MREEIKVLSGARRKFFLLRVADMDTDVAMKLTGVTRGTYNNWVRSKSFSELYKRRDELSAEYKQEAIQLLRRDTQREAALLESKIVAKMGEELETGEYKLLRTHLGREIYTKLMSDLDATPQIRVESFDERVLTIISQGQLTEGEAIDAKFETVGQPKTELEEGKSVTKSEQTSDTPEEKVEA